MLGSKGAEIGTYGTPLVYQEPFKRDSSIGSRVINEVVLEEEFREVRMYGILGKSTPAIVTWHSTLPAYLEKNGHVAYRRDASKLV